MGNGYLGVRNKRYTVVSRGEQYPETVPAVGDVIILKVYKQDTSVYPSGLEVLGFGVGVYEDIEIAVQYVEERGPMYIYIHGNVCTSEDEGNPCRASYMKGSYLPKVLIGDIVIKEMVYSEYP
ncbi:hypothetical protein [Nonomuraea sp. NPDC049400]|uniref:hypothetical protein n=1 Tax=Nonomuraea sp. NPDC049400 TaxID=3364352 RepID=UPI0037B6A4FD